MSIRAALVVNYLRLCEFEDSYSFFRIYRAGDTVGTGSIPLKHPGKKTAQLYTADLHTAHAAVYLVWNSMRNKIALVIWSHKQLLSIIAYHKADALWTAYIAQSIHENMNAICFKVKRYVGFHHFFTFSFSLHFQFSGAEKSNKSITFFSEVTILPGVRYT